MTITTTDADVPSAQGFRSVLRSRWQTDELTGRLEMRWEEVLELWPPDPAPSR